jgi:hypothetical protein
MNRVFLFLFPSTFFRILFLFLGLFSFGGQTINGQPSTGMEKKKVQKEPAVAEGSVDVKHYLISLEILPESHRLKAQVTIDFLAQSQLKDLTLDLNPNCSMTQVLDSQEREIEHRQDAYENNNVKVYFASPIPAGTTFSLRFLYEGIFEKGRKKSLNTLREVDAVISEEGCYLPFAAKWIPVHRYPSDRATAKMIVSVPLGYVALGPGEQLPSRTDGIQEIFTSVNQNPHLPSSLVVSQFFPRTTEKQGRKLDYFFSESSLSSIDTLDELIRSLLAYYERALGAFPWKGPLHVVEVPPEYDYFPGSPSVLYLNTRLIKSAKPDVSALSQKVAAQWWNHALPVSGPDQCWLQEAFSYYAEVLRLESEKKETAVYLGELQVTALEGEGKSALANAWRLGYMTDHYLDLAGGKGAWVLHMLRQMMGHDKFDRLLSKWRVNLGSEDPLSSSFQKLAEEAAGEDLNWFFTEWVESMGVPQFEVEYLMFRTRTGFRVTGAVKQDKDLFRMPVEVGIQMEDKKGERVPVMVTGKRSDFRLDVDQKPIGVLVDPENNVLRDSPELKISVYLSRGRKLAQREEFVEAVQQYEEALALNPRRSLASYLMGEVFYEQWNMQNAANAFREALNGDLDPKWVETWSYIYLGKIFDVLGQRERAVAEYTKAVNTKDDTFGAQAEAKKYLKTPFTRPRTAIENR